MAQEIINYGTTANDGTGDPLRTAFIKTDNNFDQIWAAGPVGSNISIINNTVGVSNTNGNLILSPNGVGKVQFNRDAVPRINGTYNLGAADLRWRELYVGVGGIDLTGNLTISGADNLHIGGGTDGYFLKTDGTGNLSWAAPTSNSTPAGSNTQLQFNNAGSFGGSGNLTFDYATSNLTLFGNIFANNSITTGNLRTTHDVTVQGNLSGNILVPGGNGSVLYNRNGILGASPQDFSFDESTFTLFLIRTDVSGNSDGTDALYVGNPGFTFLGTAVMGQFTGNVPSYSQINFQNINNSSEASGDFIITADNGTNNTHFINLGITSSTWDGFQPNSLGNRLSAGDGYLYIQDGNLVLAAKDGNNINSWLFAKDGKLVAPGIIKTGVFVAGDIPDPVTAGVGARAFVTDADSISFGNIYVGGAGNSMPVFSNGSSWLIG